MNWPLKLLAMAVFIGMAASYTVSAVIEPANKRAGASPQGQAQGQALGSTQQRQQADAAAMARNAPGKASGSQKVEISADAAGQYHAMVEIDGRMVNMLVDTGATFVSLTHEDAASLGLRLAPSDYNVPLLTANGELRAARTRLRRVRISAITANDIPAIVLPRGASSVSLLGMSFLKTLKGIEVASGTLVMRP